MGPAGKKASHLDIRVFTLLFKADISVIFLHVYLFILCRGTCATEQVWRSEDNLLKSVLAFYHGDAGD